MFTYCRGQRPGYAVTQVTSDRREALATRHHADDFNRLPRRSSDQCCFPALNPDSENLSAFEPPNSGRNANHSDALASVASVTIHANSLARPSMPILSYAPLIDAARKVAGTRVTLHLPVAGNAMLACKALDDLTAAWPKNAKPIIIGLSGVLPDPYLLDWNRPENAIIEVPASMMSQDMGPVLVQRFHDIGVPVCLFGKPSTPLPPEILPAFRYSLIRVEEDTRLKNRELASANQFKRSIQSISVGVEDMETLDAAFATGATAVEGWPWLGSKSATWKAAQSSEQVILRLIQMVNSGESPAKIDQLLRQDVTIAYKLMRYINSPAFGLAAEITSFQQAVMLLGYEKLQRWLSLLLLSASKDVNKAPVMQTALRRAFFMERIGQDMDAETRDQLFITGAFSLLDAIFGTTFEALCEELTSLPQTVVDALLDRAEPLGPYLKLAEAVEQRDGAAISRTAQSLALSQRAVNRALLAAIGDADSLELL